MVVYDPISKDLGIRLDQIERFLDHLQISVTQNCKPTGSWKNSRLGRI